MADRRPGLPALLRARPRGAGWLPVGLAVAAIAVQIAYPRLEGATRDGATIAVVVLFAAASLTHAWLVRGGRTAALLLAVFAGGGLAVELLGVATGFPFGDYAYSDRIGPMVGDVPLLIPLAWAMLGYPSLVVGRLVARGRLVGPLVAAVALTAWDLYLDPQMVAEGYWTWGGDGASVLGGIPVTNYLAWLGTAWLMMQAAWGAARRWDDRADAAAVPLWLYLWTWVGSAVAHLVYLDLPASGVAGAVGMGTVVAVLAVARRPSSASPTRVTSPRTPSTRKSSPGSSSPARARP